jgi:hypothetical protein
MSLKVMSLVPKSLLGQLLMLLLGGIFIAHVLGVVARARGTEGPLNCRPSTLRRPWREKVAKEIGAVAGDDLTPPTLDGRFKWPQPRLS